MSAADYLSRAFGGLKLTNPLSNFASINNLHLSLSRPLIPPPDQPPTSAPTPIMPWDLGYNPFDPFHHRQHQPPPPPGHKPRYTAANPSPYYLEQAAFYAPPTRSDPSAPPPLPPLPPFSISNFIAKFLTLPLSLSLSFRSLLFSLLLAVLGYILEIIELGAEVFEIFYEFLMSMEVAAFVLAWFVVEMLPGWKKGVLEALEARERLVVDEPVYSILLAGREAFGTGSVRWD